MWLFLAWGSKIVTEILIPASLMKDMDPVTGYCLSCFRDCDSQDSREVGSRFANVCLQVANLF